MSINSIPCQKALFDVSEVVYLTNATRAPLLIESYEAGVAALGSLLKPWSLQTAVGGSGEKSPKENVLEKFAQLINASAADVAYLPSTSSAMTVAANNFVAKGYIASGSKVAILKDQFWSNVYPWQDSCKASGATLDVITKAKDATWCNAVLQYLQGELAKSKTVNIVLALPTVLWINGEFVDLETIGAFVAETNKLGKRICLVVDATQSVGAMPFDVNKVKPDFLCASVYKWLLGPPPFCLFYAANEPWQTEGIPLDRHMMIREQFVGGVKNEMQLDVRFDIDAADGPYPLPLVNTSGRFNIGGLPHPVYLPMLQVSLEKILEWGVENIQSTLFSFTQEILDHVTSLCPDLIYPKVRCGHIIGIKHKNDVNFSDKCATFLRNKNIMVASRFGNLRISPYLYNDEKDIATLCNALTEFIQQEYK